MIREGGNPGPAGPGRAHRRSLGFARDDRKGRVVVRERAVAKGRVVVKGELGYQSAK